MKSILIVMCLALSALVFSACSSDGDGNGTAMEYSVYAGTWTRILRWTSGPPAGTEHTGTIVWEVDSRGNASGFFPVPTDSPCGGTRFDGNFSGSNTLQFSTNALNMRCSDGSWCCTGRHSATVTFSDPNHGSGSVDVTSCCDGLRRQGTLEYVR